MSYRYNFLRLIFIGTLLLSVTTKAKTLTWSEAVKLAQQNNVDVQAAQKEFEAVVELESGSKSGFLPKLSASLSENQSGSESGSTNTNWARTYSAQLNLNQNLFAGFADIYRSRTAAANTKVATATKETRFAAISLELRQAFEGVLYAQNYKKLSDDIIQRRKENLKNVQLQFQSGRENKGSVLLSESYVDQADLDDLSASQQQEVALEDLRRLLGLPSTEDLQLVDSLKVSELPLVRPSFEELAIQHPDVISAQAKESLDLNSWSSSRARFLPSLDLNASYGNVDTKFFPDQNRWSVGVTLSVPLFDGLSDYATYKSSHLRYRSSQLQAGSQVLKTRTQLKEAYNQLLQAIQKQKVDESFNRAAVVRAQIARSKYKNGLMSFDDWDLVETDLIARQKSMLASRRDRILAQARWEQAQGQGVFE